MAFFTAAVGVLQTFVTGMGGVIGVWGFINLLEAYGSDNPGARSQGIKQLAAGVGVVLVGITLIPQLTSLFAG